MKSSIGHGRANIGNATNEMGNFVVGRKMLFQKANENPKLLEI